MAISSTQPHHYNHNYHNSNPPAPLPHKSRHNYAVSVCLYKWAIYLPKDLYFAPTHPGRQLSSVETNYWCLLVLLTGQL
jgi:hypothetical protein